MVSTDQECSSASQRHDAQRHDVPIFGLILDHRPHDARRDAPYLHLLIRQLKFEVRDEVEHDGLHFEHAVRWASVSRKIKVIALSYENRQLSRGFDCQFVVKPRHAEELTRCSFEGRRLRSTVSNPVKLKDAARSDAQKDILEYDTKLALTTVRSR